MSYQDDVYIRSGRPIEGIQEWMWVRGDGAPGSDGGAWRGPREDWEQSHSHKYFKHVKSFGTVIQAGGCLGMYPRFLSSRFNIVYTFEPDPLNFYCLVNNCQLDNIIKMQCALGDKNGFITIIRNDRSNVGMHKVEEKSDSRVPIITIDSLKLKECDMIMLDTEGSDALALKGAFKTIKKFKPVIVTEDVHDCNDTEAIVELLTSLGYKEVEQSISDRVYATE